MLECVGLLGQERWSNVKCMSHSGKWGLRDQAVHRKKVGNLNTVIKMHASYLMVTEHENWPFGWSILTGIELLILTCARFLVPIEKLVFWRKWFFFCLPAGSIISASNPPQDDAACLLLFLPKSSHLFDPSGSTLIPLLCFWHILNFHSPNLMI